MGSLWGSVSALGEVYWAESRSEAEMIVAEMESAGLRPLKCGSSVAVAAEPLDYKLRAALLMAVALLELRCTRAWERLSMSERARLLAPLYKAVYGLYLASGSSGEARTAFYTHAVEMLREAIIEASRLGLLKELRRIERARSKG